MDKLRCEGERPLVIGWRRRCCRGGGRHPEHSSRQARYTLVHTTSKTEDGKKQEEKAAASQKNKCRKYHLPVFCWWPGRSVTSPGATIHNKRASPAEILYFVTEYFRFPSSFFYTILKQMQSHFVRTCEVSNYASQISEVSHPNICLLSNEHL